MKLSLYKVRIEGSNRVFDLVTEINIGFCPSVNSIFYDDKTEKAYLLTQIFFSANDIAAIVEDSKMIQAEPFSKLFSS